jgi:transketolase
MEPYTLDKINEMARQIRRDIIKMLVIAQSGHTGGPLGLSDIFAALYFNILKLDPQKPSWEGRDYFFLSAGHLCPVWYATLARRGYFPIAELSTLRKFHTRLQGHPAPAHTHGLPGIEIASGSLGQGLSIAVGCALGLRVSGKSNRVFVVAGDGELDEGQIWEAAMTASHHKVDNLIAIVDRNNCQIDNFCDKVMEIEPVADKWRSFGWHVLECDGNDTAAFMKAVDQAKTLKGKPTVIIARTAMGKGVSFMENDYKWHGIPPSEDQAKKALAELAPTAHGDFIRFDWEQTPA